MTNSVRIYHNPACGTSRNALALLRHAGLQPEVIEYLQTPPSSDEIKSFAKAIGYSVRDLLREKGTPFAELGLSNASLSDDDLLAAIEAHPILLNRPIVVTDKGTALCRPSELVLDLLENAPAGGFSKDDGAPFLRDEKINGSSALRDALSAEGLPTDDLDENGRHFYRYETLDGEPVGFGGFESYGKDALIRSIVVNQDQRGKGLGKNLTQLLLTRAFNEGARQAWLLTTSAAPFFERAGFKTIERENAPQSIKDTRQAQSLCPSSAPLLTRRITL